MKGQNDASPQEKYDHSSIEEKWQKKWEEGGVYQVPDVITGKKNFYELVEFTYPSGNLHVGHWYAFAVPDIHARFKRMQGYNVLYPMGFDAFGLPAENAAIKLGADPKVLTYEQMDRMRTQLRSMGAMFDWDREVVSCAPEYYKWTQWMFTQFLKHDLVYRAITKVNWCPKDQTVLANEQVVDGCCERCGTEVVQRNQEQWMLRITKYADALIDDLDVLDWPHAIKESQKNWIGRSEGSEISFKLSTKDEIKVFTTRADTLFGVTYIVLAPEHELLSKFLEQVENKEEVESYIDATKKKLELERQQSKEKTGVELKGVKAINPANGEEIPVWIADYVLAGYGTGAVMAVPAHDERDFEFAKKYNLPIKQVTAPLRYDPKNPFVKEWPVVERHMVQAIVRDVKKNEYLLLKWKDLPWITFPGGGLEENESMENSALREIEEETGLTNLKYLATLPVVRSEYSANHKEQNRISYCYACYFETTDETKEGIIASTELNQHEVIWKKMGEFTDEFVCSEWDVWERALQHQYTIPIPEEGVLINSNKFNGLTSEEARKKITEFVGGKMVSTYRLRDWGISRQRYWGTPIPIVYDPAGNAHPVPDEHLPWLLPTDVDHTPDGTAPLARSKELLERTEKLFGAGWKPEVETMDTFVDSSWYFYRYLDNKNDAEFASREKMKTWMPVELYLGGPEHTTMHVLYSRFWVKAMKDCDLVPESEPYTIRRNRGLILGPDGNKMSKSKGNVINPDEIVECLGADTVRMYLAFMGPYGTTANYPWDPNGVVGVRRFLERVWDLQTKLVTTEIKPTAQLHKAIQKITEDIEEFKFNTSISQMMILLNEWGKVESITVSEYKTFLKLLAPFAPHITEELWHTLGEDESIHLSKWPEFDENLTQDEQITIAVQVNGKVRDTISISPSESEAETKAKALASEKVKTYIEGRAIKNVIVVPGKIVNIVIEHTE